MSSTLDNVALANSYATIDGLVVVNANELFVNGQAVTGDVGVYLPYTGGTMTGNIQMNTNYIQSSHVPSTVSELTNKAYVDAAISGLSSTYVPYTGASSNIDLGTHTLTTVGQISSGTLIAQGAFTAQNQVALTGTPSGTPSVALGISNSPYTGYVVTYALPVPYTGATGTVNLGSQDIQTSYAPTVANDLTNKNYVDTQTALRVPYTGATSNVNLGSHSLTGTTAQFTSITSATPALALGVDGSGNLNTFAVPTATNLLPLNNTWTGTNTFNNNLTLGDGYNATFAEIGYIGQNYITSATPTTTGLTAIAPTPTGTITFSTPTYTMTPSGASTFASFWSSATFTGTPRCFFNFTNMSLANAPGSATITVCQANTGNTAYVNISSAIAIPQSAPIFSGYFTPNTNASYLGQIFFILSNVKFNPFSWTAFTYGYGTLTVQGNETVNGTLTLTQPSGGNQFQLINSSANAMYMNFNSNGGAGGAFIGMDSSTGTGLFGSGIPYSFDIGTYTATPICFFTNNVTTPRMKIDSTGNTSISGNFTMNQTQFLYLTYASPSNYVALTTDIYGAFYIQTGTSGVSGRLKVDSAGNTSLTGTLSVGSTASPGYVTMIPTANATYCGFTEFRNGGNRYGYIGYGSTIGGENCLDIHGENGWGIDIQTNNHNILFSTDGGATQKLQIGTIGCVINGGSGYPALSINTPAGNPMVINGSGTDSNILFSCTGTGGRSYYVGSGGTGSGGGAGNFYIYDQAAGGTRFAINSVGQTIIGGLGMTTNVPYANTYFYNSGGTYTGTSSTFGAYRYITFDSGRIYGAMSVATFQNGTITPLYNGMYCITFMAGGAGGASLEIFISRNLHNNNDFNTGTPMADGLLACSGVLAAETTITWTGYLATTDVVCCGCYTSGSAWTPYQPRSGITIALIQRMS